MKRKYLALIAAALCLVGCKTSEKEKEVTSVSVPVVTASADVPDAIGEYADLVDNDLVAEAGDMVNIDFTLEVEDDESGELSDEGHSVSIWVGDGDFLPALEEKLIGTKSGDEFDFTTVFPDDYWAEDYIGKTGNFHVIVNYVYRNTPLAEEYSMEEAVEYLLENGVIDEPSLVETMVDEGFDEAEVKKYLAEHEIDWGKQAISLIDQYIEYSRSRRTIEDALEMNEIKITKEIKEHLDTIDWNSVAGRAAEQMANQAYSLQFIENSLSNEGFKEDEVTAALESVEDIDWNKQALKCLQYYDTENMSDEELSASLEAEGFTDEQIAYAIKNK